MSESESTATAPLTTQTHARTGSARDWYVDFLRFLAIARVVIYHTFPFVWLTWIFPAMGVMFALGGSLMANSMAKPGGHPVRGRLRRLLPALWVFGAVVVPLMIIHEVRFGDPEELPGVGELLLWIFPIVTPPGTDWAFAATEVLWYIVAYLWLVILSPLAMRAYRRWPLPTVLFPLLVLAVIEIADLEIDSDFRVVVLTLATYGSCWLVGFAHRDGKLHAVRLPVLAGVAGGAMLLGTVWGFTHVGEEGLDLNGIRLAQGLFSFGFVLLALRLRPNIEWLRRRPVLNSLVTFVNARAVTIYLWHNPAIAASFPIGARFDAWRFGDTLGDLICFGISIGLVLLVTLAVGWVEDLAARRPPRLIPR